MPVRHVRTGPLRSVRGSRRFLYCPFLLCGPNRVVTARYASELPFRILPAQRYKPARSATAWPAGNSRPEDACASGGKDRRGAQGHGASCSVTPSDTTLSIMHSLVSGMVDGWDRRGTAGEGRRGAGGPDSPRGHNGVRAPPRDAVGAWSHLSWPVLSSRLNLRSLPGGRCRTSPTRCGCHSCDPVVERVSGHGRGAVLGSHRMASGLWSGTRCGVSRHPVRR
jgi:hypothetical protein